MSELPGRSCPIRYRYGAAAIAAVPLQTADTLYVIGGLYGNVESLKTIEAMAAQESGPVRLCFNGDFNWFNVLPDDFEAINQSVLRHDASLGNVEAELAAGDLSVGCGCAYPEEVSDGVVDRSNRIFERLLLTATQSPKVTTALAKLPMVRRYQVGQLRVGVVHGDYEALAGWNFDVAALSESCKTDHVNHRALVQAFADAQVDLFASSHTCLPALVSVYHQSGLKAVINNGAAGMPNFSGQTDGLITRISSQGASPEALYGAKINGIFIEALPVKFDQGAWQARFLRAWPAGSDAYESYFERIRQGPNFSPKQAMLSNVAQELAYSD